MRWIGGVFLVLMVAMIAGCQKDVASPEGDGGAINGVSEQSDLLLGSLLADTSNVSGIDYVDGIYDLTTGSSIDSLAEPVYHSASTDSLPCQVPAGDTSTTACIFDETDLNADGSADIEGVNKKRLIVDKRSGVINLSASMNAGVFGSNPANGQRKGFRMYYRLNDDTNRALQTMTILLVHYKSRSDVPSWLVNEIAVRRQQYNTMNSLSTSRLSLYAYVYQPKRPPLIVIVSGR